METELPTKAPCIFKKVDNRQKMCQLTSAVLYSIFWFLDSLFCCDLKKRFFEKRKYAYSWLPQKAILRGPKKLPFIGDLEKRNLGDRKNRRFGRLEKAIFRKPKKSPFCGDQKKRLFGDRKKSRFRGDMKRVFCGPKNRLYLAIWISDYSGTQKIAFSWRPEKGTFRGPKRSPLRGDIKKRFFRDRRNRLFAAI